MAQELKLTKTETAALDRIEAALMGPRGKMAVRARAADAADLCKEYRSIRPALLILIKIIRKIPKVGPKVAAALEFLMKLADAVCPA